MANYGYVCKNGSCSDYNVTVTITKPIAEYDKPEKCLKCDNLLTRTYNGFGAIKTGDGFKH